MTISSPPIHTRSSLFMPPTPPSSQDRGHFAGLRGNEPDNPEYFFNSQLQEKQAIATFVEGLDKSTYLSPSQQSAIETLQDLEDGKVLELLSFIRLLGHAHHPCLEGLSNEQSDALSDLKVCSNSLITLSLRYSRGLKPPYPNI